MIPKIDKSLRNAIYGESRRAAPTKNWFHRAWQLTNGLLPRLGISDPRSGTSNILQLVLFALFAFMMAFALTKSIIEGWSDFAATCASDISHLKSSMEWSAGYGCVLLILAFLCFAGGTSKRLHQISRLYPQPDVSLKHHIKRRTIAATTIVFIVSFIIESWFAVAPESRLSLPSLAAAFGLSIIQTAFVVSLVLIAARKFVPSFESYFYALAFLAIPMFLFMMCGRIEPEENKGGIIFGYPQLLVSEDLLAVSDAAIQWSFFPAWAIHAMASISQKGDWLGGVLLVPVGIVILYGARGFIQLWNLTPKDLDSDAWIEEAFDATDQQPREEATQGTSTPDSATTPADIPFAEKSEDEQKQFVGDRIDQLLAPPQTYQEQFFSFLPSVYRLALASRRSERGWRDLERPEPLTSKAKNIWAKFRKLPAWALLFILPLMGIVLFIVAGIISLWFSNCFEAPDSPEAQATAQLTCLGVVIISLLILVPTFRKHEALFRYPDDPWKSIQLTLRAWGRALLFSLPLLGLLNSTFCWYYDFSIYQQAIFILQPLVMGAVLLMFSIGFQWCLVEQQALSLLLLLVFVASFLGILFLGLVVFLPAAENANFLQLYFAKSSTMSFILMHARELSMVALFIAGLTTMISLVKLNHSRWVDIPSPVNSGTGE